MSYSINPELHPYADKNGLHKLSILIIYKRIKIRVQMPIKLKTEQLQGKEITNHPNRSKLNGWLKKEQNEVEARLISLLQYNPTPTPSQLKTALQGKVEEKQIISLQDLMRLVISERKQSVSGGRLKQYNGFIGLMDSFRDPWRLAEFDLQSVNGFHDYLYSKGFATNTIWSKLNILKTIRTQAVKRELIVRDPFLLFRGTKYQKNIPVFLTEPEITQLQKFIEGIGDDTMQQVGWYFLLSCFAGFRISDLKSFEYATRVQGQRIILRTKKTGEIVSVKIHTRLAKVLKYCKEHRLIISEQKCNQYLKDIARMAGIKKHLKMHSGRHSFAMLLASKGFTEREAMELMGITNNDTVKTYFRITNERLDRVVMEKLG